MNLIMKSGNVVANIKIDHYERVNDVVFAYSKDTESMIADKFVGMFDLGAMDYLYITESRNDK